MRLLYICRSDVWLSYTVLRKYCFHFLLLPCAYIISTILYPRLKAILSTSLVFYQQIYDFLILTTGQWPANTHTLTQTDPHSASLTPCFVFVGTSLYAPQIHTKWEPGWLSLTYHYLPYPPLLIIPLTLTTELLTITVSVSLS